MTGTHEEAEEPGTVRAAVLRELQGGQRQDTALGRTAQTLAQRIDRGIDTGSALATLSRELRATLEAAMHGVKVSETGLDDLRARRDAKRA